jgi:ribosome modulation factor
MTVRWKTFAVLLIALGCILLWLSVSGRFDSQAAEVEYFYYQRGYAVGSYGAPSTCCPDAPATRRKAWMRGWADGMEKYKSKERADQ